MNVTLDKQPQRPSPAPIKKRRSRLWLWIVLIAVAAVGIYFIFRPKPNQETGASPDSQAAGGGNRRAGGGGRGGNFVRITPAVNAEAAHEGDLPNYVDALGTVTALNTAIVRARVNGELIKINFEEGQDVKAGDVLAEIDPRPFQVALDQAQGQLARDRAMLSNSQLDLQRYQSAQEAVTQQQVDTAKATVAQNEGVVKTDEGAVANADLQLSFCHVVAPIDGRVGLRQVDVGNLVTTADANGIVVITQIKPIAVRFSVPEDSLPSINRAMSHGTELNVDISDRSFKNKLATGKLVAIDNQIDTTTGTLKLKSVSPNDDLALFPNQFVNVRLLVSVQKNATLIPTSGIQINGNERYVYLVKDDNTVQRHTVKTGNTEGIYTAITDGLSPGDKVVTEGLDRLQDGMKVNVRTADEQKQLAAPVTDQPQRRRHGNWNGQNGQNGQWNGQHGQNGQGTQSGQGEQNGQGGQHRNNSGSTSSGSGQ